MVSLWMVYWTPISNPLTLWERGYVGVPGISLSLYLCSLLLIRMHTYMYDVYNATPACITYSYYCPCSVCTYVHPCLAPAPLLLCVCVPHIPIHIPMYVHLCTIQYTLRTTPYCTTVLVLCHLHIYMCVPKYTYSIHISTSITCYCMSSSHPLHIRYTSGTCYMAYAITRSVAYMLLCHVSSTPRYHDMECPIWTSIPPGYLHILISIESMESMESMI